MKKIILACLGALVIMTGCSPDKVDLQEQPQNKGIRTLRGQEEKSKVNELHKQVRQLVSEGKPAQALAALDEAIRLEGENRGNLGTKHGLLMKMGRYAEALKVALRRDEITPRKSPWNTIPIVESYLKLGNKQKAMEYMSIAVNERHFIYLDYLEADTLAVLKGMPEFRELQAKIKELIGIGKPAPDFSLPLLNGENFSLSAQKGKVILVDFWATWCPPCRKEIPLLRELYAGYANRGFAIIGISLDDKEETVRNFIRDQEMAWAIAFSGRAWADETANRYHVSSIPSTFLVDREGILRHFNLHGPELEKAVTALLEQE